MAALVELRPGTTGHAVAVAVLADDTIDAVVVATPVDTHFDLCRAALAAGKPDAIDAYVALSQLLASQGRPADAQTKLAEAKKTLPPSAAIFRAVAEVDLGAGRYDTAREGYEAALKIDPEDLASRFKLGVTLRRMNRFDPAQAEFDKVAALDKEYP
ncbi:hypothetical protein B4Q13_21670, partial [Lacticaseibacillus rhamnosus]